MKIVDTTIFLAEHEAELLHLKLTLESFCVDEWVLIENHYTYRGEYKGPKLATLLQQERFAPFRDRVTYFSIHDNFSVPVGTYDPNKVYDPKEFAEAEWKLRDAPTSYLLQKYNDRDMVFVSDVDEVIDFLDPWRRERLMYWLNKHETLQFDRVRYWWDVDCRAWRDRMDMVTPAFSIRALKAGAAKLRDKKWVGRQVQLETDDRGSARPYIFEYSFCFDRAGIDYKYGTSLHTKWSREAIDTSILCNHWTMRADERVSFQNRFQWFERVPLNRFNSPQYVIDNYHKLKTNLVPDDYRERRKQVYNGFVANFPENIP